MSRRAKDGSNIAIGADSLSKPIALFVDRIIRKILSGEYPPDVLKEYADWILADGRGMDGNPADKEAIRKRAFRMKEKIQQDFAEAFELDKFVRQKGEDSQKNAENS